MWCVNCLCIPLGMMDQLALYLTWCCHSKRILTCRKIEIASLFTGFFFFPSFLEQNFIFGRMLHFSTFVIFWLTDVTYSFSENNITLFWYWRASFHSHSELQSLPSIHPLRSRHKIDFHNCLPTSPAMASCWLAPRFRQRFGINLVEHHKTLNRLDKNIH